MGAITLQNVEKWYGDVQVIKGIDLEIPNGEFVVFVGANSEDLRERRFVLDTGGAGSRLCRQHQRRALTSPSSSTKITSPGSGWSRGS